MLLLLQSKGWYTFQNWMENSRISVSNRPYVFHAISPRCIAWTVYHWERKRSLCACSEITQVPGSSSEEQLTYQGLMPFALPRVGCCALLGLVCAPVSVCLVSVCLPSSWLL